PCALNKSRIPSASRTYLARKLFDDKAIHRLRKSAMKSISSAVAGSLLALSVTQAFAAGSPGVERNTQAFLEALAAGGGKPLETLAPKDARAVLAGAQSSVKLELPAADVSQKTIEADG